MISELPRLAERMGLGNRRQVAITSALFIVFFVAFNKEVHFWILGLYLPNSVDTPSLVSFLGSFQLDSDQLVVDRLRQNQLAGVFSAGMQLGVDGAYTSQFGLSGWLLALIPSLLNLPDPAQLWLMYSAVAAFSAVFATGAVRLSRGALSPGASAMVAIALLQPWSVAMAGSLYWMIGVKLLPSAMLLILLSSRRESVARIITVSFAFSSLAFLSGYEFLTVVAATQFAVVTYFAVLREARVRAAALSIVSVAFGLGSAFMFAISIHFIQLYVRLGDLGLAVTTLETVITKRTGVTGTQVDAVYAQSLAAYPSQVLDIYLGMPVFGAPLTLPVLHYFTMLTLLPVCAVLIVVGFRGKRPGAAATASRALGVAWFVALLGPLGWFLLARPHSFIHTHINFSLWFFPIVPLGLALLWDPIRGGMVGLRARPLAFLAISGSMVLLLLMYGASLMMVR